MAVVHSDVARLRQMGGPQPQMYVSGTCDVRLSVVGAMGRSWYSHWGEFQQKPAPPFNVQSPPITANYNWSHRMSIVAMPPNTPSAHSKIISSPSYADRWDLLLPHAKLTLNLL